jgi:VanZ family protein
MFEWMPFGDNLRRRQVLFVVYLVLIAVLSLTPSEGEIFSVKHVDKVGHFLAYVLMAVLALISFGRGRGQVTAVILTFVLGLALEWGQGFVPGRTSSLTDGLTNFIGLGVGIGYYWLSHRR